MDTLFLVRYDGGAPKNIPKANTVNTSVSVFAWKPHGFSESLPLDPKTMKIAKVLNHQKIWGI